MGAIAEGGCGRRRLRLGVAVLTLAVALAGCSSDDGGNDGSKPAKDRAEAPSDDGPAVLPDDACDLLAADDVAELLVGGEEVPGDTGVDATSSAETDEAKPSTTTCTYRLTGLGAPDVTYALTLTVTEGVSGTGGQGIKVKGADSAWIEADEDGPTGVVSVIDALQVRTAASCTNPDLACEPDVLVDLARQLNQQAVGAL